MARQKSNYGGGIGIDRLTTLPESVLCHILSFLPTITSVATMSLVSHRWRHLWKYLQVFHFDNSDFNGNKKFALFVNAVLALRRSRDIRKFNLQLERRFEDYKSVEMWVLAATGPHLEEMSIKNIQGPEITLPPSFFVNCTNLVSLSLTGDIYWKHSSIHSPSLKNFVLLGVPDWDEVFLSGFPALETLDTFFKDGNFMNEIFGQTSSNSMSLKSTNDNLTWTYLVSSSLDMTLGIVSYFQSMLEVFLHVFPPCESEFIDPILEELLDFEDISLVSRHSTSKGPLHAPVLNYPEFHSLQHLKFILPCFNSNLLLNVLEKCHVLQVLIIQSNKEEPPPSRTWEQQSTTIPKCLKTHLTYIHIEGYQGFDDELTFAEYILRNGLVLETMLIFVDISMDITNKYHSIKRLTNISKGSVKCQLKFDPDGSH